MSDVDDDLLALAGAGGSETEDEMPVRQAKAADDSYSSQDEEATDEEDPAALRPKSERMEEEDDENTGERNPYPLEGKYKNEADRAKLLAMPEIERESILFDRSQEMQRFEERRYLAQRAALRKQEQDALKERKSHRERETTGVSSEKRSGLQALKQRREAKLRRAGESESEYEGDSESDEEMRDASDNDDKDGVEWADADEDQAQEEREISVNTINNVRFGKTLFSRFCHYPQFEQAARGCFMRVNIGYNSKKQQNVYRVCEIKKVETGSKTYKFLDRTTDQVLLATHAGSERRIEMGICSDAPITQEEFDFWKHAMEKNSLSLPSRRRLEAKFKEITAMRKRPLSNEEIEEMVNRRKRLAGGGANADLGVLQQQRDLAQEQNDEAKMKEVEEQIELLKRQRAEDERLAKLARVNERNRRTNIDKIRKAEAQAQASRRKTANANVIKADPFSRLRTNARTFYTNEGEDAPSFVVEEDAKPKQRLQLSILDHEIAKLDIPLEIEI